MLANQAIFYLASGLVPQRLGNAHATVVPYQVFAVADGHITTMQLMKLLNAISGARRAVGFVHPSSLDEDHEQGRVTRQNGIFIPSKLT